MVVPERRKYTLVGRAVGIVVLPALVAVPACRRSARPIPTTTRIVGWNSRYRSTCAPSRPGTRNIGTVVWKNSWDQTEEKV